MTSVSFVIAVISIAGTITLYTIVALSYSCRRLYKQNRNNEGDILPIHVESEKVCLLKPITPSYQSISRNWTLHWSVRSATLLSPIVEENEQYLYEDDEEMEEVRDDLQLGKKFCEGSESFVWIDMPFLKFGKNIMKRSVIIGKKLRKYRSSSRQYSSVQTSQPFDPTQSSVLLKKQYESKIHEKFLLSLITCPKSFVVSSPLPTLDLTNADNLKTLKVLLQAMHQFNRLVPVLDIQHVHSGKSGITLAVVTPYTSQGSLKDLIYNRGRTNSVKLPYDKKYGRQVTGKPLQMMKIAHYGRQILEGLICLRELGLPFFHLHNGNILIDEDNAKLANYENVICGMPTRFQLQNMYLNFHQNGMVSFDVYLFGHVLYEMAFGMELTSTRVGKTGAPHYGGLHIKQSSYQVIQVLDFIFQSRAASKARLTEITLQDVLSMPLFGLFSCKTDLTYFTLSLKEKKFLRNCMYQFHQNQQHQLVAMKQSDDSATFGYRLSNESIATDSLASTDDDSSSNNSDLDMNELKYIGQALSQSFEEENQALDDGKGCSILQTSHAKYLWKKKKDRVYQSAMFIV